MKTYDATVCVTRREYRRVMGIPARSEHEAMEIAQERAEAGDGWVQYDEVVDSDVESLDEGFDYLLGEAV